MTRNNIYDGLHRAPINSTAGKVQSGGTQYTPNKRIAQKHWEVPPPTISIPKDVKNLTGYEFGRLKVIGLLETNRAKRGTLWLVRCSCSHYESRRSKSIQNKNNTKDCCENCRHLVHLQNMDHRNSTGKYRCR